MNDPGPCRGITIERPSSARLPSGEEISSMWRDLVSWLIHNAPVEADLNPIHAAEEDILLGKEFFGK